MAKTPEIVLPLRKTQQSFLVLFMAALSSWQGQPKGGREEKSFLLPCLMLGFPLVQGYVPRPGRLQRKRGTLSLLKVAREEDGLG